jgi:hypothetical protein
MWMLNDSADPLNSWSYASVIDSSEKRGLPKNDLYGALYFYLLAQFQEFSRRLHANDLSFTLLSVDARKIERALTDSASKHHIQAFDRIDVSNIVDRCYIGLHSTLGLLGRLLKTRAENPHASLIALFMNYHEEQESSMPHDGQAVKREIDEVMRFISASPPRGRSDPQLVKVMDWRGYFQDFDKTWESYKQACSFNYAARSTGMKARTTAKIIANRPYAIDKTGGKEKMLAQFRVYDIGGLRGHERYVEWERAM